MVISELPIIMVRCLVLTILFELFLSFILGVRDKKDFINITLVNVLTNPIVVSLPIVFLVNYGHRERMISLYTLEVITVLVEGFIYKKVLKYKKINPFLLSLLLNGFSYFVGEIINRL